jgi:hypothetical protein
MKYILKSNTDLYIAECCPEDGMIHLVSDYKKAAVFFKVDADLIKGYAEDKVGCKFSILDV